MRGKINEWVKSKMNMNHTVLDGVPPFVWGVEREKGGIGVIASSEIALRGGGLLMGYVPETGHPGN